jgi:hypothetical protein
MHGRTSSYGCLAAKAKKLKGIMFFFFLNSNQKGQWFSVSQLFFKSKASDAHPPGRTVESTALT